jgi:hypothetical protein
MAMPFMHGREEALELRRITFDQGARAFKHKGLNYFEQDEVLMGTPRRRRRRNDTVLTDLLVESGEPVEDETRVVVMPVSDGKRRWIRLEPRQMPVLRSGYARLNDINWGYLI